MDRRWSLVTIALFALVSCAGEGSPGRRSEPAQAATQGPAPATSPPEPKKSGGTLPADPIALAAGTYRSSPGFTPRGRFMLESDEWLGAASEEGGIFWTDFLLSDEPLILLSFETGWVPSPDVLLERFSHVKNFTAKPAPDMRVGGGVAHAVEGIVRGGGANFENSGKTCFADVCGLEVVGGHRVGVGTFEAAGKTVAIFLVAEPSDFGRLEKKARPVIAAARFG